LNLKTGADELVKSQKSPSPWFFCPARILASEARPVVGQLIKDLCMLCTNVPLILHSNWGEAPNLSIIHFYLTLKSRQPIYVTVLTCREGKKLLNETA